MHLKARMMMKLEVVQNLLYKYDFQRHYTASSVVLHTYHRILIIRILGVW